MGKTLFSDEKNAENTVKGETKKKHKYLKPLLVILAVILFAKLTGLGVWYWQQQEKEKQKKESDKQIQELQKQLNELKSAKQSKTEKKSNKGFIEGTITFPSEKVPADLVIYAENIDTGEVYETSERITDDKYTISHVGYKLEVPAGNYYVYAKRPAEPGKKAYHNKFITCGMSVGCDDTTKIPVTVVAGETEFDITVGDWWNI